MTGSPRVALVTGAGRGIGHAIATALANDGWQVALADLEASAAQKAAAELPGDCVGLAVDVSDEASVAVLVRDVEDRLGPIELLVNNAGASPFGPFDAVTDEQWIEAFTLKVLGYTRAIRAVLPDMRAAGKGRIVNVVGSGGRFASPDYALGALNAAMLHLTKSVGDRFAGDGVRVLAVNPGLTSTGRMLDALETWAADAGVSVEQFTAEHVKNIPLGRAATPEEIAQVICVLCSPLGDLTIGSAFQADGGGPRGAF